MFGLSWPYRLQPMIDPLFRIGLAPAMALWAVSLGTPVGAHGPGCLFRLVLGQDCWGCGTLRALAALLRLDLSGALALNPLSPLGGGDPGRPVRLRAPGTSHPIPES
jgi:hypothetical protein